MKPIKSSRLKIIQKQNRAEYIIIKIIIKSVIQHYDSFHLRVLMTQGLLISHIMKTLLLIGCWGGSEAALSSLVHTGAPESTTGPLKCNSVLKLLQTSGVCQVCVRCASGVCQVCHCCVMTLGLTQVQPTVILSVPSRKLYLLLSFLPPLLLGFWTLQQEGKSIHTNTDVIDQYALKRQGHMMRNSYPTFLRG